MSILEKTYENLCHENLLNVLFFIIFKQTIGTNLKGVKA